MAEFKQLAEAQGLLNALKLCTMVNLNPLRLQVICLPYQTKHFFVEAIDEVNTPEYAGSVTACTHFFLSELLPGNYGNMTSKFEFDWHSQRLLPWHSFCSHCKVRSVPCTLKCLYTHTFPQKVCV